MQGGRASDFRRPGNCRGTLHSIQTHYLFFEEQPKLDPEQPLCWDDVSGKPPKIEKLRAARLEECEVIE